MTDDYRDELEATLRRADELEQGNAALVARNTALVAGTGGPLVVKRRRRTPYVLAATSIVAGTVFAMIPGCEPLEAVCFLMPLFALIAVGLLRVVQWLDEHVLP